MSEINLYDFYVNNTFVWILNQKWLVSNSLFIISTLV